MPGPLANVRHGLIASFLLLSIATAASAQSITDPTRIEFAPSGAPGALDVRTGTPLVEKYTLEIYRAGGSTIEQTIDLGRPSPEPDGKIRVDLLALLTIPLSRGVVYEAVVNAVGPLEVASSARSETFAFSSACTPAISPSSSTLSSPAAANGSIAVTANSTCAWTATSSAGWITITSNAYGSGNAVVTYTVAANTLTSSRTGTMTVGDQTFTVTQAGASCVSAISPTSSTLTASISASGAISVVAGAACRWTAVSNDSWITVGVGATGTGNATVAYNVAANTGSAPRTGTLTIGGYAFTVTQPGAPCGFTLSPFLANLTSPAAADGSVTVSAGAGCDWTATSNAAWITIRSGASGSGSGTVNYTVAANTGTTSRTGTMTIAGRAFTVTQPATSCAFTISPTSQSFPGSGGSGSVAVTTSSTCSWTASSAAAWVTVSGTTGTGSGTVTFNVAANTSTLPRSAMLTIAGKSFTVTQSYPSCTFTLTPSLINAPPTGTSGSITVATQATCAWTATTSSAWVTVSGSGAGSGTVTYTVQPNTGTFARSTIVNIGGVFVGVNQPAATAVVAAPVSLEAAR